MNSVKRAVGVGGRVAALMMLTSAPAIGQVDLSGVWAARNHEDQRYRQAPGPLLGDYMGLPINDEGRARAESWLSSLQALPERQCIMYTTHYLVMQPFGIQIVPEMDSISGQVIAWRITGAIDRPPQTIWMDGRPHPSKTAPHTAAGFSTGEWRGDTLAAYTTHLTEGQIWRNGVPHSDQATVTQFIVRHGTTLTIMMILDDPVYLEEPFVRTSQWQLDPATRIVPDTCQPQVEIVRRPGEVPHYLPGANPYLAEVTKRYNVPAEAARGGAATTYPEYRKKLTGYVPPPPEPRSDPPPAGNAPNANR